jgi:hypothetical protein
MSHIVGHSSAMEPSNLNPLLARTFNVGGTCTSRGTARGSYVNTLDRPEDLLVASAVIWVLFRFGTQLCWNRTPHSSVCFHYVTTCVVIELLISSTALLSFLTHRLDSTDVVGHTPACKYPGRYSRVSCTGGLFG